MADKTINELRAEVVKLKEENKKLHLQNVAFKANLRDCNLKRKEWHARYLKLRQRLDELK